MNTPYNRIPFQELLFPNQLFSKKINKKTSK